MLLIFFTKKDKSLLFFLCFLFLPSNQQTCAFVFVLSSKLKIWTEEIYYVCSSCVNRIIQSSRFLYDYHVFKCFCFTSSNQQNQKTNR